MYRSSAQLQVRGAGTIRRVVRQGHVFLCGMCRDSFDNFSDAISCVRHCWEEVLLLDPVIERRFPAKTVMFRCRFCARDHETHELADHCAKDCKDNLSARFALEIDAWGLPQEEVLLKRTKRKVRPQVQAVSMQPMLKRKPIIHESEKSKGDENVRAEAKVVQGKGAAVESPKDAHGKKAQESSPKLGEPKGSTKAHEAKEAHGAEHSDGPHAGEDPGKTADTNSVEEKAAKAKDPFTRSGAQYICSGCQKKYFTRDEVEKCFASHISS